MTFQPPKTCPACHQRTLVELVFGMPGPELFEAAEQGELALGGCCITPTLACDSPDLTCTTCSWTGFELYGQLFEENDLSGVMNAHAQHASELFLQGTGLSYFVDDNDGDDMPAGWTEMLSAMSGAFGELVEHATTVRQPTQQRTNPSTSHPSIVTLSSASKRNDVGAAATAELALAVITAHAEASDATAVRWQIGQQQA